MMETKRWITKKQKMMKSGRGNERKKRDTTGVKKRKKSGKKRGRRSSRH